MKVLQESIDCGIPILDPSELLRPEAPLWGDKSPAKFRDYSIDSDDPVKEKVRSTYHLMHTHQTVDFVKGKQLEYLQFKKGKMSVRDALEELNCLVDESDPDTSLPNLVHAFQTAERIRREHPDKPWLQLTGLVHDLGKRLALHGEPQWAVVGDTFVVGCAWPSNIVYRETSFLENKDRLDERYNTSLGMYRAGCGLDSLLLSWGHDEYLYQVLRHNGCSLPPQALYMLRYHSFYPYHTGGEYAHLASEHDRQMMPLLQMFNRYDLYTKDEQIPDIEALWPYYQALIDQYMPGQLEW